MSLNQVITLGRKDVPTKHGLHHDFESILVNARLVVIVLKVEHLPVILFNMLGCSA